MAVDLLAASRRPLQRLLHDCSFSEWENIALFLDGGSTEAVRWAGGLGFVLEELGISQVLDLQVGVRVSGCCTYKGSVYANISNRHGWKLGLQVEQVHLCEKVYQTTDSTLLLNTRPSGSQH